MHAAKSLLILVLLSQPLPECKNTSRTGLFRPKFPGKILRHVPGHHCLNEESHPDAAIPNNKGREQNDRGLYFALSVLPEDAILPGRAILN
jgi:hypothetical protein